jgi:glycosyltransferase involved in cell wall biosynthesis
MASLPPITVICPNVSSNALGRALLLADLIRSETRVQVVGMRQGATVWAPASSSQVPVRAYPLEPGRAHYFDGVTWLRKVVGQDFVIVSKPVLQSFGLALLARCGAHGMVVDIDDWQTGFFQYDRGKQNVSAFRQKVARLRSYARRGGLNGFVLTRLLEEYSRTKHRIASNRWLQRHFGGELLYHVRDPDVLDPAKPASTELRRLSSETLWVGFVGTLRAHKGIRVLVDAVARARSVVNVGLALMGVDDQDDPEIAHARQRLPPGALSVIAPFPLSELRDHLALVDILSIPSLSVPGSWGQIPAKLFDAMSMAKPIVATSVNDIPEILDGVGLCVPPGDSKALAEAIVMLSRDVALRERLGRGARQRLIEKYSYAAGRRTLLSVVERALGSGGSSGTGSASATDGGRMRAAG